MAWSWLTRLPEKWVLIAGRLWFYRAFITNQNHAKIIARHTMPTPSRNRFLTGLLRRELFSPEGMRPSKRIAMAMTPRTIPRMTISKVFMGR